MFLLQIAYALVLAPISYFGVRDVFTQYQVRYGKHSALLMRCLQGLFMLTPLFAAFYKLSYLYSLSVMPATVLFPVWLAMSITSWHVVELPRRKARRMIKTLETIIEDDFDSIDRDGDDSLNEQDIVNASINFKDHEPEKAAALEQLLSDIADVGQVVGVIEQSTYSDDILVGTVRRNIYAVRKSDLRKYPATLRSKYRIW